MLNRWPRCIPFHRLQISDMNESAKKTSQREMPVKMDGQRKRFYSNGMKERKREEKPATTRRMEALIIFSHCIFVFVLCVSRVLKIPKSPGNGESVSCTRIHRNGHLFQQCISIMCVSVSLFSSFCLSISFNDCLFQRLFDGHTYFFLRDGGMLFETRQVLYFFRQ